VREGWGGVARRKRRERGAFKRGKGGGGKEEGERSDGTVRFYLRGWRKKERETHAGTHKHPAPPIYRNDESHPKVTRFGLTKPKEWGEKIETKRKECCRGKK